MKMIKIGILAFLFTLNSQAQNKNVKTEITTKITTIKDSEGEKKVVKTEEKKELQEVELQDADSNILNKDRKETPIEVLSTTKITADGVTRLIDIDRSAYYNLDGIKYQVAIDKNGYTINTTDGKNPAVLRKTSNNNFIYRSKSQTSFGYFDADGDLIIESYDQTNDTVSILKYTLVKE